MSYATLTLLWNCVEAAVTVSLSPCEKNLHFRQSRSFPSGLFCNPWGTTQSKNMHVQTYYIGIFLTWTPVSSHYADEKW